MSDTWVPKVGDRVIYNGETMTLESCNFVTGRYWVRDGNGEAWSVRPSWLSPAPEPEPEEPTAPGALVRDGRGNLLVLDKDGDWLAIDGPPITGDWFVWIDLPRPVTVVLADPAEVEQLLAEVDSSRREVKAAWDRARQFKIERDKLQNELDYIYRRLSEGPAVRTYEAEVRWREWVAASISRRGES